MTTPTPRRLALLAGSIMTLALAAGPASSTEAITFVSFGGAYTESQNKAYIEPFQQESGVRAAVRKSATEVA